MMEMNDSQRFQKKGKSKRRGGSIRIFKHTWLLAGIAFTKAKVKEE
jgi:hypothetical protein